MGNARRLAQNPSWIHPAAQVDARYETGTRGRRDQLQVVPERGRLHVQISSGRSNDDGSELLALPA